MADAGYDPAAAVSFWQEMTIREQAQLKRLQERYGAGKVKLKKEWQTTHPLVSSRFVGTSRPDC